MSCPSSSAAERAFARIRRELVDDGTLADIAETCHDAVALLPVLAVRGAGYGDTGSLMYKDQLAHLAGLDIDGIDRAITALQEHGVIERLRSRTSRVVRFRVSGSVVTAHRNAAHFVFPALLLYGGAWGQATRMDQLILLALAGDAHAQLHHLTEDYPELYDWLDDIGAVEIAEEDEDGEVTDDFARRVGMISCLRLSALTGLRPDTVERQVERINWGSLGPALRLTEADPDTEYEDRGMYFADYWYHLPACSWVHRSHRVERAVRVRRS